MIQVAVILRAVPMSSAIMAAVIERAALRALPDESASTAAAQRGLLSGMAPAPPVLNAAGYEDLIGSCGSSLPNDSGYEPAYTYERTRSAPDPISGAGTLNALSGDRLPRLDSPSGLFRSPRASATAESTVDGPSKERLGSTEGEGSREPALQAAPASRRVIRHERGVANLERLAGQDSPSSLRRAVSRVAIVRDLAAREWPRELDTEALKPAVFQAIRN